MPNLAAAINNCHFTMFKGEPGTLKSTQALTYPKPQYWFSYDQKMRAMILPMKNYGINGADISYDDYSDWSRGEAKLESFRTQCAFKTIILDSITSMADMTLRQSISMKEGQTSKSGNSRGRQVGGIDVNELEDYNAESAALTNLMFLLKDIHNFHKVNIIIIAHVIRTEQKDVSGVSTISRTIVTAGKKPAAKLPAYCDEVYHFQSGSSIDTSKGGDYEILTAHVGEDFARTGLPLPKKITIGYDNLYDKYILPAEKKLTDMQTVTIIK